MIFLKLYFHIISFIKKIFYRIIYGKRIKFGKGVHFRKGFSLIIEDGAIVDIGDGTFFNNNCSINAYEKVIIGKDCLFGENVKIYDHNHIFNKKNVLIKKQGFKSKEIIIGNNSWIGSNCIILKGSNIGSNVVIGAGEIVRNKVNENQVLVNNICSAIKFEEDDHD